MNLYRLILTENDCYKAGGALSPKGVMIHSTGANNPYLRRYIGPDDGKLGPNPYNNHWNQPKPDGQQKCVHGFVGKLADGSVASYQTLPWNMRGWHAGGSANNTHIGFEICEDYLTNATYFGMVYTEATELCAHLCAMYKLDPSEEGVVIDHSEGFKMGVASNHSDVGNWFPKHGKTMKTFRADVAAILRKGDGEMLTTMNVQVDNGEVRTIPSILKDGLNYPNLRELAALMDYKVGYEQDTKVVTLYKDWQAK